ncbi:MAG: hypothetical protein CL955_10505 [Erythrobacteraceae bacterium]|nr:hypothetical protein [Erythrobacteraceae bacterium]
MRCAENSLGGNQVKFFRRFSAVCVLVVSILAAPTYAQERSAVRHDFDTSTINETSRILVFRPRIRVGEQSTGGMFEPRADWTELARENLGRSLESQRKLYGSVLIDAPEAFGEDARLSYMAQAGFRPSAASEVWRAVMNEEDQTAIDRGRRPRRYQNAAFFASHPTSLERADTLSALANRVRGGEYDGFATHREAMKEWLPILLADELALNDFGGTDYLIGRLAGDEISADLLYARGELYRGRGNPRDLVSAAEFYRQALNKDEGVNEAWRGLGLSLLRNNNADEGREALRRYLELVPEAADAAMLQSIVGD